jgi:hypothetical protein
MKGFLQEELDNIYERIGGGEPITEELGERILVLKDLLNPREEMRCESTYQEEGCGCGHPANCWDCAAIRGGCPEDA